MEAYTLHDFVEMHGACTSFSADPMDGHLKDLVFRFDGQTIRREDFADFADFQGDVVADGADRQDALEESSPCHLVQWVVRVALEDNGKEIDVHGDRLHDAGDFFVQRGDAEKFDCCDDFC